MGRVLATLRLGDDIGWSIDDDRMRLTATARRLGYEVPPSSWARFAKKQAAFHPSHFDALRPRWTERRIDSGLSYFHGRPGTDGYPEFDQAYDLLRRHADRVDRVQVTHAEMYELAIAAGVASRRSFAFRSASRSSASRSATRRRGSSAPGARPPGGRLHRRLVRQGRGWPRPGIRAEAARRAGHSRGDSRPPARLDPGAFRAPDRPRARLCPRRARPAGGSTPSCLPPLPRRARARRITHSMLSGDLTSGGWAEASLEAPAAGVPLVTTRVGQVQTTGGRGRGLARRRRRCGRFVSRGATRP